MFPRPQPLTSALNVSILKLGVFKTQCHKKKQSAELRYAIHIKLSRALDYNLNILQALYCRCCRWWTIS